MKVLRSIILLGFLATSVHAEVRATLTPRSGVSSDQFLIEVTTTEGEGEPTFESSPDFQIEQIGTSTQLSIVNGVSSSSTTYRLRVRPRDDLPPGEYPLPAGRVKAGALLPQLRLTIEKTSTPKVTRAEGLAYVQVVDNLEPYVGEQLTYRAEIASNLPLQGAGIEEEEFRGFLKESYGKGRNTIRRIAGSNTQVIAIREAIYPNQSGTLKIPPRGIEVQVQVAKRRQGNWSLFDDIFSNLGDFSVETRKLSADGLTLQVKPLPPPPTSGYIPVGKTKVSSSIDRKTISEGEGVSLTVMVESEGNIRPLDLPIDNLGDFELYPEAPTTEVFIEGERLVQKKRYVIALVPKRAGEIVIPAIPITYFDPKSERYLRAPTDRYSISVIPDPKRPPRKPVAETPREVEVNSEELFPTVQVPVSSTWRLSPGVRSALLWLILALAVGISLIRYAVIRKSPREKQRADALPRALALLGDTPESLGHSIRLYLSERYDRELSGMTAKESEGILIQLGANTELASLLREIEQLEFSPRGEGFQERVLTLRTRCEMAMKTMEGR